MPQCQADSMMHEALSARRAGEITILTSLPVFELEVLASAIGCQLSLCYGVPFFAGLYGALNSRMI